MECNRNKPYLANFPDYKGKEISVKYGTIKSIDELSIENNSKSNAFVVPSISLQIGGGPIIGIDKKFQLNGSNNMAVFTIPLLNPSLEKSVRVLSFEGNDKNHIKT